MKTNNEYMSELFSNDKVKARNFQTTKRFIDDLVTLMMFAKTSILLNYNLKSNALPTVFCPNFYVCNVLLKSCISCNNFLFLMFSI